MTKIFIDSTAYKNAVMSKVSIGASKLESASRLCSTLSIPARFRYYSYLANLNNVVMECSKKCETAISSLDKDIASWENTKNRILSQGSKLENITIKKRDDLIK